MILDVRQVSRSFGGLKAVADVTFSVADGEIAALIGPNGAGKTTLFSLIAGFLHPDGGRILFGGRDVTALEPHNIASLGLVRTFQLTQPFGHLTVAENIAVGAHLRLRSRGAALRHAARIAERVGLADRLDQSAESLTVAGRKRLELARALATEPRLLLLDEVMAGLNPREIDEMVAIVRAIRDGGVTVLLTEHVMRAVMQLSDRTLVLNDGRLIAEGTPRDIAEDPRVIEAYLGGGAAKNLQEVAAYG
jgi:branched-chain amino acid transport system ATP-binding protein